MTLKEKLNLLEEVLDVEKDSLGENTLLEEIEQWDSIAVISTIAMLDNVFGKEAEPEKVKNARTVKDILDLME